ncbi:hypothetical protein SAMN04488696_2783 [Methanolobus profundi]|uniref:Uncharacterized protein n=1 Tax=Methanolobus profundi TaxID=487685 RepID=A0A1I4UM37_9EURY|nr:hypothetical protein SAMN04488696_2783 [Methanolobus profundi]
MSCFKNVIFDDVQKDFLDFFWICSTDVGV